MRHQPSLHEHALGQRNSARPPSGATIRPLRRDRLRGLLLEYLHCTCP